MQSLSLLIITHNEEIHIDRIIENTKDLVDEVVILDSGSTDKTCEIAKARGARVYQRKWDNYASQRNHLLENIPIENDWVIFLDADEYLTKELKDEIRLVLSDENNFDAFYIKRRFYWMGSWIKRGYYPTWLMRLGRYGKMKCEPTAFNEHLVCTSEEVGHLNNDFIDENLKPFNDWLQKHIRYAELAASDLLNPPPGGLKFFGEKAQRVQWIRHKIYRYLPPLVRPFFYFIYRYFIQMGFLDGFPGFIYHVSQALIFNLIVDVIYLQNLIRKDV